MDLEFVPDLPRQLKYPTLDDSGPFGPTGFFFLLFGLERTFTLNFSRSPTLDGSHPLSSPFLLIRISLTTPSSRFRS